MITKKLWNFIWQKDRYFRLHLKVTQMIQENRYIQIADLLEEGAILCISDPKVSSNQIAKDLNKKPFLLEVEEVNNPLIEVKVMEIL